MSDKKRMECVREFIMGCPFLKEGVMHVDYLGIAPTEYSINGMPSKTIIKEYIDGSSIRQFAFLFGSVEAYGSDVDNNMENSGFYELFSDWIEEKNRKKEFPVLDGNKEVMQIEAQGDGYVNDTSEGVARYQIQCRMVYYQRGEISI